MSTKSEFDPYHKWLGIPPHQQPPTHYRLLGLEPFEADLDVIQAAAARQMAHLQTYKIGPQSECSQQLLNEIARAKVCLLDPHSKTEYDRKLRGLEKPAVSPGLPAAKDTAESPKPAAPLRPIPVEAPVPQFRTNLPTRRGNRRNWLNIVMPIAAAVVAVGLLLIVIAYSSRSVRDSVSKGETKSQGEKESQRDKDLRGKKDDEEPLKPPVSDPLPPEPPKAKEDARAEPTSINASDDRVEWVNTTYGGRVVRMKDDLWEERREGHAPVSYREVARTAQYVEVLSPPGARHTRFLTNTAQQSLNGQWAWVSFGYWTTQASDEQFAKIVAQQPPPIDDRDSRRYWINATYSIAYERRADGMWDHLETNSGKRTADSWKELARTPEYVELFSLIHRFRARLFADHEMDELDGKWGQTALGRWSGSEPRVNSGGSQNDEDFIPIFNGKDLTGWNGDTAAYAVEGGNLVYRGQYPANLITDHKYTDFHLKFEYKLTAGADSGVGFRTPASFSTTQVVPEVQLLDESWPAFQSLPAEKKNASCGVAAARQGAQRRVGIWNREEVIVKGNRIRVLLNGDEVLDDDWTRNGKLDVASHPALAANEGHLALLGFSGRIEFRDIRVLPVENQEPNEPGSNKPSTPAQPIRTGKFSEFRLPSRRAVSSSLLEIDAAGIKREFSKYETRRGASGTGELLWFLVNDLTRNVPVGLIGFDASGEFSGPTVVLGESGQPSVFGWYTHGQRHGVLRSWSDDGMLVLWSEFKLGKKSGLTCLCAEGRPIRIEEWDNGRRRNVYLIKYRQGSVSVVDSRKAEAAEASELQTAETTLRSIERLIKEHEEKWLSTFRSWYRESDMDAYEESKASEKARATLLSRF